MYLYLYNNTRLLVVYYYIVTSRAAHLDNGHTTCATKNDTPALSAPEFITISQSESPEGGVYWRMAMECVPDDYKPPLREIQIPKEWKENTGKYSVRKCKSKSFKFKWLTLYVRNGFRRKIFGSNSKVYNLPFQKFSLQSSKHFTAKNIRFEMKSFKSKWLTLYVRNGFRRKIFGSNSKV
jgi:hypothetical protein